MYYWLSLFHISSNLPRYCAELHHLPSRPLSAKVKTQLFVALFCLLVLHFFYKLVVPMDAFHRTLHYDMTFFLNTVPSVNFVPFATELVQLFNFYGLYWFDLSIAELLHCKSSSNRPVDVKSEQQKRRKMKKQIAPVRLIEQVFVKGDERSFLFRIDPATRTSVHTLLMSRVKVLTFTVDVYLSFFMTLFHLYLFGHYLCGIFHYRSVLFTSAGGLFQLSWSLVSVFLFLVANTGGVSMTCIYFMLHFAFGHLVFLRLSQCNHLLLQLLRSSSSSSGKSSGRLLLQPPFGEQQLSQFTAYHSETMRLIAINGVSFGQTVLASIVTYSLVNSYLSQLILAGVFDLMTAIIMANFIAVQWVLLGGFHLMAASYARRIHLPKGRLLAVSAVAAMASNNNNNHNTNNSTTDDLVTPKSGTSVGVLLKLNAYIARLNVVNRYGISYGKYGLISSASFLKFLFIYGKLFMY